VTRGPRGAVTSRQLLFALTGVALGMAVFGAVLFAIYANRAAPDPRRLAVAPFDVMVERPELAAARVGVARALTAQFDSSGLVTAVPQAEVARFWRARETPFIAAIEVARRTGAGLAVYGRVDPADGDSVWVRVAVLDAYSTRGLFEVQALAPVDREGLDRAVDSVAASIIRRVVEN
jgi:hypothetical protein